MSSPLTRSFVCNSLIRLKIIFWKAWRSETVALDKIEIAVKEEGGAGRLFHLLEAPNGKKADLLRRVLANSPEMKTLRSKPFVPSILASDQGS
jgi:hypothetical protein